MRNALLLTMLSATLLLMGCPKRDAVKEAPEKSRATIRFEWRTTCGLATAPVESDSATSFMSRPACSAIAIPSARLAICTAPIRLLINLKTVPVPTAPKCRITSLIGAR